MREMTPLLIIAVLVTLFKNSLISVKKIRMQKETESRIASVLGSSFGIHELGYPRMVYSSSSPKRGSSRKFTLKPQCSYSGVPLNF